MLYRITRLRMTDYFAVDFDKKGDAADVFIKNTPKTPPKAIKIAMERAKEAKLI